MNQHRGSDFNEFLAQENLMTPTPRTDAIVHRGYGPTAYIAEMTNFARQLERELANARKWSSRLADVADELTADLAVERALADKLLAITEKAVSDHEGTLHCVDDCKCSGRRIANDNAEALAAWKEARK